MIKVDYFKKEDISGAAEIASQNFSGLKEEAEKWITCNFNAFPRMQYFAAKDNEKVVGYILWMEKGGF